MNNEQYKRQVGLLIRIMPAVYQIKHFAVHGGTAINLFHQDMPRYSIDIDLTYIPIEPRSKSLENINQLLRVLSLKVCKYSFYSLSFHSFFIFSSFHFLN